MNITDVMNDVCALSAKSLIFIAKSFAESVAATPIQQLTDQLEKTTHSSHVMCLHFNV